MSKLFQVYKGWTPVMSTDYVECIYDNVTLKNMNRAGYHFKLNGKSVNVTDVIKFKKQNGIND